mmetsp:Transcript_11188/g.26895  ORF Transcript_11188/g.26895 Transcript_11188/m.26895 type:complete len:482 (-) Transcript_11188:314-1759(-)
MFADAQLTQAPRPRLKTMPSERQPTPSWADSLTLLKHLGQGLDDVSIESHPDVLGSDSDVSVESHPDLLRSDSDVENQLDGRDNPQVDSPPEHHERPTNARKRVRLAELSMANSIRHIQECGQEDFDGLESLSFMASANDDNRDKYYPTDSYSFVALNGPSFEDNKETWPIQKVILFFFGLLPFLFQMTFFALLSFYFIKAPERDGGEHTGGSMKLPDQSIDLLVAQIASMAAYLLYPNSSQQGVVRAIQMFLCSYSDHSDAPIGCIRLSCLARGLQSHCAITVVFLLVIVCDDTLAIILNLTAVSFISELDAKGFELARSGVFGPMFENEAKRIAKKELPACSYSESKHKIYGVMLAVYTLMFGGYGYFIARLRGEETLRKTKAFNEIDIDLDDEIDGEFCEQLRWVNIGIVVVLPCAMIMATLIIILICSQHSEEKIGDLTTSSNTARLSQSEFDLESIRMNRVLTETTRTIPIPNVII